MVARQWARGQLKAPNRFPIDDQDDLHAPADTTDEALAAFGLQAQWPDPEEAQQARGDTDTPLHLWPENWPVWCLWRDCETQWRDERAGLDYTAVRSLIADRFRRSERRTVFYLVQGMEEATLAVWRERAAANAA